MDDPRACRRRVVARAADRRPNDLVSHPLTRGRFQDQPPQGVLASHPLTRLARHTVLTPPRRRRVVRDAPSPPPPRLPRTPTRGVDEGLGRAKPDREQHAARPERGVAHARRRVALHDVRSDGLRQPRFCDVVRVERARRVSFSRMPALSLSGQLFLGSRWIGCASCENRTVAARGSGHGSRTRMDSRRGGTRCCASSRAH